LGKGTGKGMLLECRNLKGTNLGRESLREGIFWMGREGNGWRWSKDLGDLAESHLGAKVVGVANGLASMH
jgi:hypothetical protein